MYRIYTEDTASIDARKIVLRLLSANGIMGATMYSAVGVYQGKAEPALVIETDGGSGSAATCRRAVHRVAKALRRALSQESVGVVETSDRFDLVRARR